MIGIFNYQRFNCFLDQKTRSLHLKFHLDSSRYLTMQTLFEFESLLTWLASRQEIHSFVVSSESGHFFQGIEKNSLKQMSREKLLTFYDKISSLGFAMRHLPQTIIFDLGKSASNLGIEFSLGADIRIAHQDCLLHFDHLKKGMVPVAGIFSMLTQLIGHARAKTWILTSEKISATELSRAGFLGRLYQDTEDHYQDNYLPILQKIYQQAPVCRIQSKMALLEMERSILELGMNFSKSIGNATTTTEDWKAYDRPEESFMSAKSMGKVVKLSEARKNRSQQNQ